MKNSGPSTSILWPDLVHWHVLSFSVSRDRFLVPNRGVTFPVHPGATDSFQVRDLLRTV